MSVPISDFYEAVRSLIGDDDDDFNLVSDSSIASKVRLIVNSGKIHGYQIDSTGAYIEATPASSSTHYTWADWSQYDFAYGFNYNFSYGNPFNVFYDQAFQFFVNYTPMAHRQQNDNDLTPAGNPRGWARLVYEVGNKYVSGMSQFHFRTRSITETIAAPKELLLDIALELDALTQGGRASERPLPLPLIAIGIRSLYSGLWWSTSGGLGCGFEYLGFNLSM